MPAYLTYHNYRHTVEDVVPAARYLAEQLDLTQADRCLLETAALFHDLGYVHGPTNHEEASAQLVAQVLPDMDYRPQDILRIQEMIRATRVSQTPKTLLQAILCDADLDVLGREDFMLCNQLLRKEMAALGQTFTDAQWFGSQWAFVNQHCYQTSCARALRDSGKRRNLQLLFDQVRVAHERDGAP